MSARGKDWIIGLAATACALWLFGNIAYAAWGVLFG